MVQPRILGREFLRWGERGSGPLETALLAGAALLMLFAPLQFGLLYHARNVASGAAQSAVVAARGQSAQADARAAAQAYVAGSSSLRDISVSLKRGQTITVTVSGRAPSLVPGMAMPAVQQSASMPIERVSRP